MLSGISSVTTGPSARRSRASSAARNDTDGPVPSSRSSVADAPAEAIWPTDDPAATSAGRCAAPDTSKALDSAAVIARPPASSSSPRTARVRVSSGAGSARTVSSVIAASVPNDPVMSFDRSKPVTFLTTRPPALNGSPRPLTAWNPSMWSRAAPALMRRGPARLQAIAPPSVPRNVGAGRAAAVQQATRGPPARTPDAAAVPPAPTRFRRAAWPASRSAPAPPVRRGRCRPAPKDRGACRPRSAGRRRVSSRRRSSCQRPALDDRGLHRVHHLLGRLRTQGLGHGADPSLAPTLTPTLCPAHVAAQVFALSPRGRGPG